MPRAYTRAVSPRLAECQLTHLDRTPIDATKAAGQHAAYEQALANAGLDIIRLPDLPDDPDAVFVEDTALLLDGHAIITLPGAASRAGETHSTAAGLVGDFEVHRIGRGHVDGGDVLRIGKRLYVGLSTRTNADGVDALSEIVRPLGFEVIAARLRDCLHLKSGATFAGMDGSGTPILLYDPKSVDRARFGGVDPVSVDHAEPAVDEPREARAVEAGRRGSGPHVRRAQKAQRQLRRRPADRRRRKRGPGCNTHPGCQRGGRAQQQRHAGKSN